MPLHDSFNDSEPKPHAPFLGGKKRVPDVGEVVWRDPATRIHHPKDKMGTVQLGRHLQTPAAWHRIQAIEQEIKENLLQLLRVGVNLQPILMEGFLHLHVLIQALGGKEREGIFHKRGQVRRLKLKRRRLGKI